MTVLFRVLGVFLILLSVLHFVAFIGSDHFIRVAGEMAGHLFVASVIIILLLLYFLPAMIGRKKQKAAAIFLLNLVLGWTLIGWVVAIVWAVKDAPSAQKK